MAEIEWRNGLLPVSTKFDDPYYSDNDGRAETEYVFINGNNLPRLWPTLKTCTIAELGFGSGLNFLETVRQWNRFKQGDAHLHFISFEQFPLAAKEIEKALSAWPELDELTSRLLEIWVSKDPVLKVHFSPNIELKVFFGDANEILHMSDFRAHAWYLDGFSPAKNPQLWNTRLMEEVFKHTVVGGTFATYTAAGFVRRNLQDAGFVVTKIRGFGKKREMLIGEKPGDIHVAHGH